MSATDAEIKRREKAALSAIEDAFGTDEDELGATLFVSHHLEELDEAYWLEHLGTPKPEPRQVLDLLKLRSHWGDEDEDGLDTFDFTLPGDVTQYIVSVSFDVNGEVKAICMES